MVQHSKERALSDREFELLLEGARRIDKERQSREAVFSILLTGRLGMRSGEVIHLTEDWIDWRRDLICIPRYEPCDSGRGGSICGVCEQHAQQRTEHNPGLSLDEALGFSWASKTDAAAREVPFDADPRAELVVERFFEKWNGWPQSQQAINRRVDRAAREAEGIDGDDVYPHCLRATAASDLAGKGLDVFSLKSMLGWSQLQTARCYVTSSGERTAQAIRDLQ